MKAPNTVFEDDKKWLGMKYEDAISKLNTGSTKYRVRRQDDMARLGTADLKFDRLNFEVDNGIITKVYRG